MILPDVNLLVYAVDASCPHHTHARAWLDGALSSTSVVGFCYQTQLSFVRLTTNRSIFESPLTIDEDLDDLDSWMDPTPHSCCRQLDTDRGDGANALTQGRGAQMAQLTERAQLLLGSLAHPITLNPAVERASRGRPGERP